MATNKVNQNDDDGRVICNMDVAGMRWYEKRVHREEREVHRARQRGQQMTKAESWKFTWYAVLAGLTVVSIFAVVWIIFILFCTQVWFH